MTIRKIKQGIYLACRPCSHGMTLPDKMFTDEERGARIAEFVAQHKDCEKKEPKT